MHRKVWYTAAVLAGILALLAWLLMPPGAGLGETRRMGAGLPSTPVLGNGDGLPGSPDAAAPEADATDSAPPGERKSAAARGLRVTVTDAEGRPLAGRLGEQQGATVDAQLEPGCLVDVSIGGDGVAARDHMGVLITEGSLVRMVHARREMVTTEAGTSPGFRASLAVPRGAWQLECLGRDGAMIARRTIAADSPFLKVRIP